jgi:hypothetical protein
MYLEMQVIYEGVRLTNGEYYDHLTDEEIGIKYEDEIGIAHLLPWDSEYEQKIKAWKELPVKCQTKKS